MLYQYSHGRLIHFSRINYTICEVFFDLNIVFKSSNFENVLYRMMNVYFSQRNANAFNQHTKATRELYPIFVTKLHLIRL